MFMVEQDRNFTHGKADWTAIKEVKDIVKIPVIGNGDIISEDTATQMFEQTGCDGIMIGRASLGNPWIFNQIQCFLGTGKKLEKPSYDDRINVLKEHFELLLKEKGEYTATREIRKFVAWYVKGMPNAHIFKEEMNSIDSKENFYKVMSMGTGRLA